MKELKILLVEDIPADAEIARHSLKKENIRFTCQIVDTPEDFKIALAEFKPDLIISDFAMPGFDGMSALKITRSQPHYIPFILLAGSMNEETAVACMKAGADDYVLKEKVRRLPFAVREALQKDMVRKEKKHAKKSYEAIYNASTDCIFIHDGLTGEIVDMNQTALDTFGFTRDEFRKLNVGDFSLNQPPYTQKEALDHIREAMKEGPRFFEWVAKKKNGELVWLENSLQYTKLAGDNRVLVIGRNISERKKAEADLIESERQNAFLVETAFEMLELNSIQEIYEYTTRKIRNYLEGNSVVSIVEYDHDTNRWEMKHLEGIHDRIDQLTKLFGYDFRQLQGEISTKYYNKITSGKLTKIDFDFPGLFNNKFSNKIGETVKKMLSIHKMYCITFQEDKKISGNITFVTTRKSKPFNYELIEAFVSQAANFVKRHRSEAALRERTELLQNITNHMFDMVAMTDLAGVFTYAGPSHRILGFEPEQLHGTSIFEYIHPDDANYIADELKEFISHPSPDTSRIVEYRHRCRDGSYIWLETIGKMLFNKNGHPHALFVSSRNVTERKRAEETIRINEDKLKSIFRVVPTGIGLVNNRILIEVNPRVCEITGYQPQELMGKSARILYPTQKEFELVGQEKYDQIINHGTGMVETRWQKKDGTVLSILLASTPLDSNDLSKGVIFTALDITDRKKAEEAHKESETKYRLLAENSGDVIFTLDFDLNYTYISPAVQTVRGYKPEEVLNSSILNTLTPASYQLVKDTFERAIPEIKRGNASLKPMMIELETFKKDGTTIWVEVKASVSTDSNGNPVGIIGVSRDISKRKAIQEQLVEATKNAQAADKLKTAFLNNISHEVRTPLNGILGFGQLMTEPDLSPGDKMMYLKILKQSSDRLISTITSYMDISLIVSGNMKVRKKIFPLSYMITNLYEIFADSSKEKGLDLKLKSDKGAIDLEIESDEELLKKILSHLLDNALKFTGKGTVQFGYKQKDDSVEFFVEDTGVGIDTELQESIFKYFVQKDIHISRGYEGSGLGLSIAKGLVELMGGTITLDSQKGKGTKVRFSIPVRVFSTTGKSSEETQNFTTSPLILIAEDDPLNALYVETVLAKMGYKTLIATDGIQAVEKCKENAEIGLVLMDIKMPFMDGLEATRQIKSFNPGMPVIATTAQVMKGDEKLALDAGCDEYISKPFKHETLVQKVQKYLGVFKKI